MKKVSKAAEANLRELHQIIEEASEGADMAVANFNLAVESYNEALCEVAGEIQCYMDERSDAWLESERGEAYQEWLECFEEEAEETDSPEMDVPGFDSLLMKPEV